MAKLGTIILTGCSKKEYSFEIYPFGTEFRDVGGVYYISKQTLNAGKGSHQNIYIGITEDLSTRFNNHHKADCFKKNNANCISILVESNKANREAIEKDLLCNYSCPCNEQLN